MSAYFVTATGTDIGKTFVTAGLVRHLRTAGKSVAALKPIVSGFDMTEAALSDPGVLLQALGEPVTPQSIAKLSPWRFEAPLSPDMAAARENRTIDFAELVKFCRNEITASAGTLFLEGVGGVMVPLDERHTVLDWMSELGLPVILVTGSYLGTISHTLTALEVLRRRGIAIASLVINESPQSAAPLSETIESIKRFAPDCPITMLSRMVQTGLSEKEFADLLWMLEQHAFR
ncbi:MAG: dethiobiotin synthase [Proteobacteria bacterium]|nr:dethiobiotin synthase [Pseudomonadota bacterium]